MTRSQFKKVPPGAAVALQTVHGGSQIQGRPPGCGLTAGVLLQSLAGRAAPATDLTVSQTIETCFKHGEWLVAAHSSAAVVPSGLCGTGYSDVTSRLEMLGSKGSHVTANATTTGAPSNNPPTDDVSFGWVSPAGQRIESFDGAYTEGYGNTTLVLENPVFATLPPTRASMDIFSTAYLLAALWCVVLVILFID